MPLHPALQDLYEQAEMAMADADAIVVLTLLHRQGNKAVMQKYHSCPEGHFPPAEAALLYVEPLNNPPGTVFLVPGEPLREMHTTWEDMRPMDLASRVNSFSALEQQWLDAYLRLQAVANEHPSVDGYDDVAAVSWEAPAPATRAEVRRRMKP